ncbi:glycosyltransferase, partial [Bacillus cereus]|nr:glycosyltransferase family 1 protein [Bacillus cereus]
EIVVDDYNGYLFDKDNAREGTQKILEIIKDYSLYDRLSKNGFRTFEEHFTIEKMLSSIEELYSK